MRIRIVNKSRHKLPAYETAHSAGMDLRALTEGPVTLLPLERKLIGTGLYIELPVGYEAQVRPRSGLAIRARNNGAELAGNNRRRLPGRNWRDPY